MPPDAPATTAATTPEASPAVSGGPSGRAGSRASATSGSLARDTPQTVAPRARRTSPTMAGVLYGLTTLFLAVGAVNGQNNLLFWAFGLALGGLLVSGMFSGSGMMGLRVRRDPPPTGRAGEPITIRYRVTNANRAVPLFCVTLTERVAASVRAPHSVRAPRGNGVSSSPTATVSPSPSSPSQRPSVAFLPHLASRQEAALDAPGRPMRRGRMKLEGLTASSAFPFGLMRKTMDFDLPGTLLVLPARLTLREDLVPRPGRRGHGGAASPTAVGHADEFFGVREYVPGDPTRLIAWRPSARGDELVVRQHGTPPPTVVWVILDLEGATEDLARERAIALAGSLIELLAIKGCSVGLSIPSSGAVRLPAAGSWHASRLVASLATLEDVPSAGAPAGGGRATPGVRREHSALVVHARPRSSPTPASSREPAWAIRLWGEDLESYLAPGAIVPEPLTPPPPPESRSERRRRWMREFFLVDPVGDAAMGEASVPVQARVPAPGLTPASMGASTTEAAR